MARMGAWRAAMIAWAVSLGDLVVPLACAGCGQAGQRLCPRCAEILAAGPSRVDGDAPAMAATAAPVWAVGPYRGAMREVVVGWKSRGRHDVEPALREAIRAAARQVVGDPPRARELWVVPAPSRLRRAVLGRSSVLVLADAVARGLVEGSGTPAKVVLAVGRRPGASAQRGRGARGRLQGARGAIRARLAVPADVEVVLVDDVLTTGATLAACAEHLAAAGGRVRFAVVLAAAPPPGRQP